MMNVKKEQNRNQGYYADESMEVNVKIRGRQPTKRNINSPQKYHNRTKSIK